MLNRNLRLTCLIIGLLIINFHHLQGQIEDLGCYGPDVIDVDRNTFPDPHSDGYMMNIDLPLASSYPPCFKITKLTITVTASNLSENLPDDCILFDYFENVYLGPSLSFAENSEVTIPGYNTPMGAPDDFNRSFEISCTDVAIPFGGQFGYDIIPAIQVPAPPLVCNNQDDMVSMGFITFDLDVCVEAEIGPSGMATADVDAVSTDVCLGEDIELLENDPDNVTWEWENPSGSNFSSDQNPTPFPSTAADFGTYIVTVTDSDGCEEIGTIDIMMNPIPIAIAGSPDDEVCIGQNIELTESGGDGLLWSWAGPNGIFSTQPNPVITNSTAADLGIYTVTVTDALGCTSTSEIEILSSPQPIAMADAVNLAICPGQDIELLETGGEATDWAWSGPNGFSSSDQDPIITNSTSADVGLYTVTITNSVGCENTSTVDITAASPPAVNATAAMTEICPGQNIELNEDAGAGISWNWSGPNGYTSSIQNPTINGATTTELGVYTVTVTDATGCSAEGSVTIEQDPDPDADAEVFDDEICPGQPIELDETGGQAVSWVWSGPDPTFSSTDQNPLINPATAADIGTYTVTVTDAMGCTATSDVTINAAATPNVNATSPQVDICPGQNIELNENGGDAVDWSWTGPDGFTSSDQNPIINNATSINIGTYTVVITDSDGCTAMDQITFFAGTTPVANAVVAQNPVCLGQDIELDEDGNDAVSWMWSGPNGFSSSDQDPSIINSTSAAFGSYTVIVTDLNGCTNSSVIVVNEATPPAVMASATSTAVCPGDDLSLNETGGVATAWSWMGPNGFNSTVANPTITNSTAAELGVYVVTVTDANGCMATDQVIITAGNCACDITDLILSGTGCMDNDTDTDDTDDFIVFTLNVQAINGGVSYTVTATGTTLTPTTGMYGVPTTFQAPMGTAGSGDLILTVTDGNDPTCTQMISVTDPGTCSGSCNITDAVLSQVVCDPGLTPDDPSDDFITFGLNPIGSNLSGSYTLSATPGVVTPASGSYGMINFFQTQPGSAGGGNITLTLVDATDPTCTQTIIITDPGSCADCPMPPVVSLSLSQDTICIDESSIMLTAGSPAGGTYAGPGVTGDVFNASAVGPGIYTITYNYTDGNGCSNSATDELVVVDLPIVDLNLSQTSTCSGGFDLDGGTPAGGVYSGPGVTGSRFEPIPGMLTYTITYTYTNTNGCSDSATQDITVIEERTDCDDGDCTNGDEVWDVTTCDCIVITAVLGCTNPTANNYNPMATCDDGSCDFDCPDPGDCDDGNCTNGEEVWDGMNCECISINVPDPSTCIDDGDCLNGTEFWDMNTCTCETMAEPQGCTDPTATNYDPTATCDDGSCDYDCPDPGDCDDGDCSNGQEVWDATNCECIAVNIPDPNDCVDDGDCTNGTEVYDPVTCDCIIISAVLGCTDPSALNYNSAATCDDGSCDYDCPDPGNCDDGDCTNGEEIWDNNLCDCIATNIPDPSSCVNDGDCTNGTETYNDNTCECDVIMEVIGCTDPDANNYDPSATCDDGSCQFDNCNNTTLVSEPCDDNIDCTINDVTLVLPDGTICEPCLGVVVDCSMTDQIIVSPCDDGNELTENDVETVLTCDGSVCIPCEGIVPTVRIFIPNSIQFDGQNENFGVYSSEAVLISNFTIYDRWGERVFFVSDVRSDDAVARWDGRRNSFKVEQGVYLYVIEFDPAHELLNVVGNITVVR